MDLEDECRKLLAEYIRELAEGKVAPRVEFIGLCGNIPVDLDYYGFAEWDKFSGSKVFPVPASFAAGERNLRQAKRAEMMYKVCAELHLNIWANVSPLSSHDLTKLEDGFRLLTFKYNIPYKEIGAAELVEYARLRKEFCFWVADNIDIADMSEIDWCFVHCVIDESFLFSSPSYISGTLIELCKKLKELETRN